MTDQREAILAIDFSLDRLDVSLQTDQPDLYVKGTGQLLRPGN